MSHLLILARMGARDGEFQRVKDAVAEIIRGATAVYLAASHLHNEESR